jgi:hypothetical protein
MTVGWLICAGLIFGLMPGLTFVCPSVKTRRRLLSFA